MQVVKRNFTHDVKVFTPIDGGSREEILKTTFNYIGVDGSKKYDLATSGNTTDFLKVIVDKFDGLTDENDKPVSYTVALRDALLDMNHVRQALIAHYFAVVTKVKTGN